ncbi:hypothetical protein Dimus_037493, partial [Dionaea muscipula]
MTREKFQERAVSADEVLSSPCLSMRGSSGGESSPLRRPPELPTDAVVGMVVSSLYARSLVYLRKAVNRRG